MRKFLTMLLRSWAASPIKIILTMLTVAFGTAILMLSFSISDVLETEVSEALKSQGVTLYGANGTWDAEGKIEQERPSQWDGDAPGYLRSDMDGITAVSIVSKLPFSQVTTEGVSYTLRDAVGAEPDYFTVFGLELLSGDPMRLLISRSGQRRCGSVKRPHRCSMDLQSRLSAKPSPPGS